jgi:hypothetical protein
MRRPRSTRFLSTLAITVIALAAIGLAWPGSALAETTVSSYRKGALVIPRIIVDGIEKYNFSGAEEGVNIWLQYSGPQVRAKADLYIDTLHNAESLYGKFVGYHLLAIKPVSPSTSLVYVALTSERGPLFVRYIVYKYKTTEYVPEIEFSLVPEAILPESLTD